MRLLEFNTYCAGLQALGLEGAEIVHVQSDLLRVGIPAGCSSRSQICDFFLQGIREVSGRECTISVCTAFEDFGYSGVPFVREQSPSRTDALSEYVRKMKGAIRSVHPIVSVTAIGPRAQWLCGGPHYDGFGYQSPWARLHHANAKIVSLGLDSDSGGTTFFHYVENLYGQPYLYTKLLSGAVYSEGRRVNKPFTMSVRYLDFGIENTPVKVKKAMLDSGLAREPAIGGSRSWCAAANDIVKQMCEMFDHDRWVMLRGKPQFRYGEIPADGPTGGIFHAFDKS